MANTRRKELHSGMCVDILVGEDVIRGYIKRVLPPDYTHKNIEVELTSGTIGVFDAIVTKSELEKETFKFYNLFFHAKHVLTIWNKETNRVFVHSLKHPVTLQAEKTGYLFSDNELAKEFLSELKRNDLALRRISRRKLVMENFKEDNLTHFRLNEERRVSVKKLERLEEYFSQF